MGDDNADEGKTTTPRRRASTNGKAGSGGYKLALQEMEAALAKYGQPVRTVLNAQGG